MAGFDFVEAGMRGYATVWENRQAIARHAAMPVLIKIGSVAAITYFDLWTNFLRQGLVFLPAYFAEGFLAAYVLRTLLSGENLMRDVREIAPTAARDIAAATIVYVLIKLVMSVAAGMALQGIITPEGEMKAVESAAPSLQAFLFGMAVIVFVIWAFRLLWLYVPVALGISVRRFMSKTRAYGTSFYMIGCWLVCFVPFYIVLLFIGEMLYGLFPVTDGKPSSAAILLVGSMQAVFELVTILIASVGMAYGVKEIMED